MQPELIRRIVEAALLAAPQPLSVAQLQALFPEDAPPAPGSIEQALGALAEENGRRGIRLIEVASGWRFQVDGELQPWIARLWTERPARYSRALLETLALVAYRQPITRGEIEQIRGVTVSSHIIKTLEEREWIRVVGHRDVPGRPALFGTTRGFLDYFGLKSLDELPPLTELQDLPELEPELPLEPVTAPAFAAAGDADAAGAVEAATDADGADAAATDAEPAAEGSDAGDDDATQLAGNGTTLRADDDGSGGYDTEILVADDAPRAAGDDPDSADTDPLPASTEHPDPSEQQAPDDAAPEHARHE
jgi:segregation and condensation protein B